MTHSISTSQSLSLNGLRVSRETQQKLTHFSELFIKWAKTINLVAPSTLSDIWSRHIADSAQIFQILPEARQWADLGSGGGFPGIITAIFLAELGDGWVHLVESNHKKAAFLRVALAETKARGTVYPMRIEEAVIKLPRIDCVSARALTDLDGLFEYVKPWAETNSDLKLFLHKGRDYALEVANADRRWQYDLLKHESAVDEDSVILEIQHLHSKI
jgi:16S rRNA (guanine(527)-N(7))-methyltransferase RsmG